MTHWKQERTGVVALTALMIAAMLVGAAIRAQIDECLEAIEWETPSPRGFIKNATVYMKDRSQASDILFINSTVDVGEGVTNVRISNNHFRFTRMYPTKYVTNTVTASWCKIHGYSTNGLICNCWTRFTQTENVTP